MKKIVIVIIFSFVCVTEAYAGLKMDALSLVERLGVFGSGIAENAGVVTDGVAMTKEVLARGEKVKTFLEKKKLQFESIKQKVEGFIPGYEGEDDASYEQEYAAAEEQLAGTQNELETQNENVAEDIEERKEALTDEYTGKKETAEQNLVILNQMLTAAEDDETRAEIEAEIASLEEMLNGYTEAIEDLASENSEILENDSKFQELLNQKEQLENQISELVDGVNSLSSKLGLSNIQGMLKKDDKTRQAEYNEVITKYFLTEDEPEISEKVDPKVKKRYDDLIEVMADAVVMAAEIKNTYDKQDEDSHRINDNMAGADMQVSALGMQTQQTIQDIEILQKYNKLLIVDLKLKTALNMLNQDYRPKNYDKDPSSLNLDNYVFDDDDIPSDDGEKGFLDGIRAK